MAPPPHGLFVCLYGPAKNLIALEHFQRLATERGVDVIVAPAPVARRVREVVVVFFTEAG